MTIVSFKIKTSMTEISQLFKENLVNRETEHPEKDNLWQLLLEIMSRRFNNLAKIISFKIQIKGLFGLTRTYFFKK